MGLGFASISETGISEDVASTGSATAYTATLSPIAYTFAPNSLTVQTARKASLSPIAYTFAPNSLTAVLSRKATLSPITYSLGLASVTAVTTSTTAYTATLGPIGFTLNLNQVTAIAVSPTAPITSRGKTGPRSGDKPFRGTYPYTQAPSPQQSWARAYWRNLKAEEDKRLQELQEAKQAAQAVRDEASAKVRQRARLESLDRVLAKIELEAEQSFVSLRKAKAERLAKAADDAIAEIAALMAARQQMQDEIERRLAWMRDDDDAVSTIFLSLH